MPKNKNDYDFSGYVTKNDLVCSDGRKIRQGAFSHQNGDEVPLVWNHQRNDPTNIIGMVRLEDRPDGVYGYAKFNDSPKAVTSKALVEHGNIRNMSIFANQLMEKSKNVMHGKIQEVSLVLAGANPGAVIDNVSIVHSDGSLEEVEGEAIIFTDEEIEWNDVDDDEDVIEHEDGEDDDPTFRDVFNSLNDDQKVLMYAMVDHALKSKDSAEHSDIPEDSDEGGTHMKKNVFEQNGPKDSLEHGMTPEIFSEAMANAKKYGSARDAFNEACLEHGITNIEYLFDEEQLVRSKPDIIDRDQGWVARVYDAASKSPFSRIKSMAANLTADEARARGYIKGKKKVDEQFALLKRSTSPQTVYKKQSFDRDDIIDISSMDVIAWIKSEMKMKLREELARAIIVGDGRNASSDDKIQETNIRPIYGDEETYVIYHKITLPSDGNYTDVANAIIDGANFARIDYKGSGAPVMFTTSEIMCDMTLAKDKNGRRLYLNKAEIASAVRCSDIVEVPVMENITRTVGEGANAKTYQLDALIGNMKDYTVGASEMGKTTMFDDFDIDYNKMKYLIETRCSGALTLPYSFIAIEHEVTAKPAG